MRPLPLFSLFFLLIYSFATHAQEDIYDYQNSKLYANYLLRTKQYDLARHEFERILFFRPQNDTVKLNLLQTYRFSHKYDKAIFRMNEMYRQPRLAPEPVAIEYSRILILNRTYDRARNYLQENATLDAEQKQLMQAHVELFSKDYQTAQNILSSLDTTKPVVSRMRSIAHDGLNARYKSPGLAVTMSAVVPGTGKMYAKDWKDGIFSMIMIGGLAWQTYRGFNRDGLKSAYGWIFGSIGFGFYLGNLYGSFKSAKRYNHTIEHDLERRIEANFSYTD